MANQLSVSSGPPAVLKGIQGAFKRVTDINLLIVPLIGIVIGLSLFSDAFLTTSNFQNLLRLAAFFIVLGVGQTFVITSGNIDLSIGSMLALVMALVESRWRSPLPRTSP